MASDKIIHTSNKNFQADVLASDTPVLVDFWATWCGPCRALAPHLDALADEFHGRLKVAKVNTDENQAVAIEHNIQGLPTLLIFRGGKEVGRHVGNAKRSDIKKFIETTLEQRS